MKIRICSTDIGCYEPERLIKTYPCLRNFNFEVKEYKVPNKTWIKMNGNPILMEYGTFRTEYKAYIEIDDLESLFKLIRESGEDLVITRLTNNEDEFELEIYDGYRE